MRNGYVFIVLMLLGVVTFELLPVIELARTIIPEEIYANKNCDCDCILQSRPWYGRFNYWFWVWVFAVPIFVWSIKPEVHKWKKILSIFIIILVCYGIMNLALHLMWDIRNAPFTANSDPTFPNQKTWDIQNCANVADGASRIFTLYFGWIPASLYVGIWLIIRKFFISSVAHSHLYK